MLCLLSAANIVYMPKGLVQVLSALTRPEQILLWGAALLALLSLIFSFSVWRNSRKASVTAADARSQNRLQPVGAGVSPAGDPALIAVLTAAIAMVLADGQRPDMNQTASKNQAPSSGTPSPAGFTIRQIRRV